MNIGSFGFIRKILTKTNRINKAVAEINIVNKAESVAIQSPTKSVEISFNPSNFFKPKVLKSFLSEKEAFEYGKKTAVRGLQGAKPYEHLVVVDGKNVINECVGTANRVELSNFELMKLNKTSKILHGHPEATPISYGDYETLAKFNANEVIAFNKKGEISSLCKNASFSEKNVDNLIDYKKKYFIEVLGVDARKIDDTEYIVNYLNQNYQSQTTQNGCKLSHGLSGHIR